MTVHAQEYAYLLKLEVCRLQDLCLPFGLLPMSIMGRRPNEHHHVHDFFNHS